jgi:hypothetical protein
MILKNLDQKLLNPYGKPFQDAIGKDENENIIYHNPTFREIMEKVLVLDHPQEKCLHCQGGKLLDIEKIHRYKMMQKIINAKEEVEFEAEEITLIKKLINWHCSVPAVGFIFDLIEGKIPGGKK